MPRARRRIGVITTAWLLASCSGPGPGSSNTATSTPLPFPQLVDVGGYSLWIDCFGEGSPVLILDAGLPGDSTDWARLESRLEGLSRVCVYDRAGEGASDPRPPDADAATSGTMAEELRALLHGAGLPPPYVLVGWSFGGVVVRSFEGRYPDEVAALVLEDVATEWSIETTIRDRESFRTPEDPIDWRGTVAELRRAGRIAVPVVIVTADRVSEDNSARDYARHLAYQRRLANLAPDSIHAIANGASHDIHITHPDVVQAAIEAATEATRHRSSVSSCQEAFAGLDVTCL